MPTLTYLGETFDCTTAIKGPDYIHLLDANGVMVASFDGITDFSAFTLSGGSYTTPTEDHNCALAVIRDDGTIGKGDHTCADVGDRFTKAETLTPETAALFGLGTDAVPDDILKIAAGKANTVTYTATVTATWTTSGDYFYQDIAVSGILATDNPVVDILPGSDNAANVVYGENMCKVFRIVTSANSIRVWATEAIETAFPIQLKVVR